MTQPGEAAGRPATQSEEMEEMKISVVSVSNFPKAGHRHKDPRAFVVLTGPSQTYRTKDVKSTAPRWGQEFALSGRSSSILKIEAKTFSGQAIFVPKRFRSEQTLGTVEMRFDELREKQKKAQEEDKDCITFDLQARAPFTDPPTSITLQVHLPIDSKRHLDTTLKLAASARHDLAEMQARTERTSYGVSRIQKVVESAEPTKEVLVSFAKAMSSINAFVKVVDAFADVHPYVKAAWAALSAGYKIAKAQSVRDNALAELLESMSTALDLVCRYDKVATHAYDKSVILQVAKKANECALFIREYSRNKNFASRAVKAIVSNPDEEIARFKKDFDSLRGNLDTGAILSLTEGLSAINEDWYRIDECVKDVGRHADRAAQTAILDKLPYAEGASWDPEKACLSNTREALLEEIWHWINTPSGTQAGGEIFCLTGVAGSGKSAIAHTIARRCHEEGILASSFFFSRDVEERSRPYKFLSTFARDLARHPQIREQLSAALEADQSLATASLSRQFGPLVLEPCLQNPLQTSRTFVVDALDEGCTAELLKILCDEFPKLPPGFRLFITSRETEDISAFLSRSPHIRLQTIDIGTEVNRLDLRVYVRHGSRGIAERRDLGESWLGEELEERFAVKSEGLFQWAAAVFQALEHAYDPAEKLTSLLAGTQTGLNAEKKMDEIYSKILQAYDWNDVSFKRDYDMVMGTILTVKSPLSVAALQSLHPTIPNISKLLPRLGALLTGWKSSDQPVRILHLSLRDFLTTRAQHSPSSAPFHICEKKHGERLAHLCLSVVNKGLKQDIPSVGYLKIPLGIPVLSKNQIPEELWYACEFWMTHVVKVETPVSPSLVAELREFYSTGFRSWMEVTTSMGLFEPLRSVRLWVQRTGVDLVGYIDVAEHYRTLYLISNRLCYVDRQEDALAAISEATELLRQRSSSSSFDGELPLYLYQHSCCLSNVGRRHDALAVSTEVIELYNRMATPLSGEWVQWMAEALRHHCTCLSESGREQEALAPARQAVEVYRRLASEQPIEYNEHLAGSLKGIAILLSKLGYRDGAFLAISEAVDLYRQLADDQPAAFNSDLASTLSDHSAYLKDLGRQAEALQAIKESVELYRRLAKDRGPAKDRSARFNHHFANALHSLSGCLLHSDILEGTLEIAGEVIELYRQLANNCPAGYNPMLANSLQTFCAHLKAHGREKDALPIIREAVELYRQLAKDEPTAFSTRLAGSLDVLGGFLFSEGLQEDAHAATSESVDLYRHAAKGCPAAFNHDLATSLHGLSVSLLFMSRAEDAAAAATEAVELCRPLADEHPRVFNHDLVRFLDLLFRAWFALGNIRATLSVLLEVIERTRKLAFDRPNKYKPLLGKYLRELSVLLVRIGDKDGAKAAQQEADSALLDSLE
ncbi:hypothetical protein BOTBODRAFT_38458 [Botryobasidium botryosum FD-172 SS1]|uniref:C2 domain-containing protein n=1 Tax=Botryobasidium botryosum (strain FD-172 SS1) TaxID=930990 RepID=A0A067LZT6_BOTB1|nr:hypothetical protein BOTBODRAFT_38458 [Botryobasidium botryosum FD-172 SS1]